MANGIARDLLELSLSAFKERYGGGDLSESHFSAMRVSVNPRDVSYVLSIIVDDLTGYGEGATIWNDNTKIVTEVHVRVFNALEGGEDGSIGSFRIGGYYTHVPAGTSLRVDQCAQGGVLAGISRSTGGSVKFQLIIRGYAPAGNI